MLNNKPHFMLSFYNILGVADGFFQRVLLWFGLAAVLLIGALLSVVSVTISPLYNLPGEEEMVVILTKYAEGLQRQIDRGIQMPFAVAYIEASHDFPGNASLLVVPLKPVSLKPVPLDHEVGVSEQSTPMQQLMQSRQPIVLDLVEHIGVGPVRIYGNGTPLQVMMLWQKRVVLWQRLHDIVKSHPLLVLLSLVGSACFCALLAMILSPLRTVQLRVREIAAGDLQTRLPDKLILRRDEIGELCRDFNAMAERLQDMYQSKERLLRDVSHELRTPLTRMRLALVLARRKTGDHAVTEYDRIERDIDHLNDLIGQILAWSRMVNPAQERPKERFSLDEALMDIVDDADFEADMNGCSVRLEECLPCSYYGDRDWLTSAVENLIRNAIRFSPEHEAISVSLRKNGETVTLSVRDKGPGVPEDTIDHLFEPFYRVDEVCGGSRGGDNRGSGLGLAIARAAVEGHGGKIRASNAFPGLLMTITLPGASAAKLK